MQIILGTVNKDLSYPRQLTQENIKIHIQQKLPEVYQNCMVGINQVLKICWEIVNKSRNVNNGNRNGQTVTLTDNIIYNDNKYQCLKL